MAVAADRNPWIETPVAGAKEISLLTRYQPRGGKGKTKGCPSEKLYPDGKLKQ